VKVNEDTLEFQEKNTFFIKNVEESRNQLVEEL
jgi:hypothetical protein